MKQKIWTSLLLLTLGIGGAKAQTDLGYITYLTDFKPTNMIELSQYSRSLGTARSAAMGGAFTSLGADMSSMSINPAGMGMYNGSEFSISPSISFSNFSNSRKDGITNFDGSNTSFGLGSIGMALNIYQGAGSLTSATVGFSYNKLADFNNNNEFLIGNNSNSIAEVFAQQLSSAGLERNSIGTNADPFDNLNIPTYTWGGILAYQSFLVDPNSTNFNETNYHVGGIENKDVVNNHYANIVNNGSVGESNLSLGLNFSNIIYAGLSLGFKSFDYETHVSYKETFEGNPTSPDTGLGNLSQLRYNQGVRMVGTGVDLKLGLIIRPMPSLRIGVAVHTPTRVNLESTYFADMYNQMMPKANGEEKNYSAFSNDLMSTPNFTTPTRLLTGISYTFGQFAILSIDYERAWYNHMNLKEAGSSIENDFKQDIQNSFKAQDNFRVGIELRPLPQLFVRGGYFNSGATVQDETTVFNAPVANTQSGFSLGLGYKINNVTIDLAYANSNTQYTMYDLYYYDNGTDLYETGEIVSKLKNNVVTLTTSIKF